MKKIAVLNDLSGLGKCSLTAAIPVLSVLGVQACPLPTAILSAQTGFSSYYHRDLTPDMDAYMMEWKKMGMSFDGIYTGFLSGEKQAEKIRKFFDLFASGDCKILVDPVMGDNGEEYPIYTEKLRDDMRMLCSEASLITPNLTEALLLLFGRERTDQAWHLYSGIPEGVLKEEVEEIGTLLSEEFDTEVVITGIDIPGKKIGNLICKGECCEWVISPKTGGSYSGTGDLFASVLAAGMVNGTDTVTSVKKAVTFLADAIKDAVADGTDRNEGVCFERYLKLL